FSFLLETLGDDGIRLEHRLAVDRVPPGSLIPSGSIDIVEECQAVALHHGVVVGAERRGDVHQSRAVFVGDEPTLHHLERLARYAVSAAHGSTDCDAYRTPMPARGSRAPCHTECNTAEPWVPETGGPSQRAA